MRAKRRQVVMIMAGKIMRGSFLWRVVPVVDVFDLVFEIQLRVGVTATLKMANAVVAVNVCRCLRQVSILAGAGVLSVSVSVSVFSVFSVFSVLIYALVDAFAVSLWVLRVQARSRRAQVLVQHKLRRLGAEKHLFPRGKAPLDRPVVFRRIKAANVVHADGPAQHAHALELQLQVADRVHPLPAARQHVDAEHVGEEGDPGAHKPVVAPKRGGEENHDKLERHKKPRQQGKRHELARVGHLAGRGRRAKERVVGQEHGEPEDDEKLAHVLGEHGRRRVFHAELGKVVQLGLAHGHRDQVGHGKKKPHGAVDAFPRLARHGHAEVHERQVGQELQNGDGRRVLALVVDDVEDLDHVKRVRVVLVARHGGDLRQDDGEHNQVHDGGQVREERLALVLGQQHKHELQHPARHTQPQNHVEQGHKRVAVVGDVVGVVFEVAHPPEHVGVRHALVQDMGHQVGHRAVGGVVGGHKVRQVGQPLVREVVLEHKQPQRERVHGAVEVDGVLLHEKVDAVVAHGEHGGVDRRHGWFSGQGGFS